MTEITFTEAEVQDICLALNELVTWEAKKLLNNTPIQGCSTAQEKNIRLRRVHDFSEMLINTRNKLSEEAQQDIPIMI